MEINIEVYRKLNRLIAELPHELALKRLEDLGLTSEIDPEKRVKHILEKLEGDLSNHQYKKIWSAAELSDLFSSKVVPFKTKPQQITLRSARQKIKHEKLNSDNMLALQLNKDPQLIFLGRTPTPYRALLDKTTTSQDIRDVIYWFPNLGILLSKIHSDENGKLFKRIIVEQLTGELEEFRIKSMTITSLFRNERYINQLVVSAEAQITGFDGMDEIQFIGPDVKKGLGGLYRRQDIRVYLHEIGPNLAVENQNLNLRVGNEIIIKSIDGIYELHMLMYPELYPTEEQLEEMEQRISDGQEINIRKLAKDWGLESFQTKFQIAKQIENGKIRAKIEGEILKTT